MFASTATTSVTTPATGRGAAMTGLVTAQPGARRANNSVLIAVISASTASTRAATATCPDTVWANSAGTYTSRGRRPGRGTLK
jgi:hypothetical protein